MNILKVGPIEKLTRRDAEAPDYTRHVWYDAEAGRLVATNGHALVMAAIEPDAGDVSGLISVQSIEYARNYAKRSAAATILERARVICEATCLRFPDGSTLPRPPGEFPDYASIVPTVSGPPTITFNPEVLAQIVAAFPKQELGKKGVSPGSISLWVSPTVWEVPGVSCVCSCGNIHAMAKGQPLLGHGRIAEPEKPSPIVVKAHYDGGLAVLMPVSGMDPAKWNTELPRGKS